MLGGRGDEGDAAWLDGLRDMHAAGHSLGEDRLRELWGAALLPVGVAAPERLRGEPPTPASDRFALGVILYQLIEGRPPFSGEGALALRLDVLRCRPAPMRGDDGRRAWVEAALSPHPDNRPPLPDGLVVPVAAQAAPISPAPPPAPAPAPPPPTPAPTRPTRRVTARGRYAAGAEVGRGALGRVYAAIDRRLGRTVAIKKLLRNDQASRARFGREAALTARLQHPGIIPVYDARLTGDRDPFYAMRLVEGQTLQDAIDARPTVDERLALLPALVTAADAVGYAHAQSVVHRDLKPTNILLGPYGETVVIDWGLARALDRPEDEAQDGPDDADAALTRVGAILGTPAWMSPEQAAGLPVDTRADVYALGAVLYTLLAGRAPYAGDSGADVIRAVARSAPVDLGELAPAVPADLLAVVRKAMQRDPAQRYAHAAELSADLRRFQTGQLVAAHRYTPIDRLRRWIDQNQPLVRVLIAAALALVALGSWSVARIVRAERVARARAEDLALQTALATRALEPDAAREALTQLGPTFPRWSAARVVLADLIERPAWLRWAGCRASDEPGGSSIGGETIGCVRDDGAWQIGTSDGQVRAWRTGDSPLGVSMSPDGRAVIVTGRGWAERWQIGVEGSLLPGAPLPVAPQSSRQRRPIVSAWREDAGALALSWGDRTVWVGGPDGPLSPIAAPGDVTGLAWGGQRLVVTDITGGVSALDPGGSSTRLVLQNAGPSWRVAVSADGRTAGLAGTERLVRAVDLDSGRVLATVPFGVGIVNQLRLDGDDLLWVGTGEVLERYHLVGGDRSAWSAGIGPLGSVDVAHDLVAVGGGSGEIEVWNRRTGERIRLAGHHGEILHLQFTRAGDALIAISGDGEARRWSLAEQARFVAELAPPPVDDPHVLPARAAFAGDQLAWIGVDGHVRRGPSADPAQATALAGAGAPWAIAACPDGSIVWGEDDGSVWRARPNEDAAPLFSAAGAVRSVTCPGVIGVADQTGRVTLLDAAGQPLATTDLPAAPIRVTGAGDAVVVADIHGVVRRLTPDGAVTLVEMGDFPWTLTVDPQGQRLLTGSAEGAWQVIELATGRTLTTGTDPRAWQLRWRPDGGALALGLSSGDVLVRDARAGERLGLLEAGNVNTRSLAWAPQGDLIAAAGDNGRISLIDVKTGVMRTLHGHGASVYHLAFSPGGETLLSVGDDHRLRLWRDDLPRDPTGLITAAAAR